MTEIEFSALVKQCLGRRIPTQERLNKEVVAIIKERNQKQIKIHWQFSIEKARAKLKSVYQTVNPINNQYQVT